MSLLLFFGKNRDPEYTDEYKKQIHEQQYRAPGIDPQGKYILEACALWDERVGNNYLEWNTGEGEVHDLIKLMDEKGLTEKDIVTIVRAAKLR